MQNPSMILQGRPSSGPLDGHEGVHQASGSQGLGAESRRKRNLSTCEFTAREEKLERKKRRLYVKSLKERLRKTESLLRAAGILNEAEETLGFSESSDDDEMPDESGSEAEWEDCSSSSSPRDSGKGTVGASKPHPLNGFDQNSTSGLSSRRSGAGNGQHASIFRWDNRADSLYFGRCSPLSILSREGIEWIKRKTGEVRFLRLLVSDTKYDSPWDYWRPDVFHDVFASKVFKPLPPRAEVFSLLRDYFRTINRLFPLYHEESFMELVEWQYTQQTCDDAARWASINVILALAYEYRYTNNLKSEKDKEKAWLYYKNAMSVFAELTLRRTDMLSVQALLGMALFLRGNSGTQSTMPLITAAIRSCHRMGLHRDTPRPHLSPVEQEQRRKVFWIAFILDQSTCIRSGNAPTQHPDDFDVDIPVDNNFFLGNNKPFFQQLCRISVIKSRIYTRLYSAKALQNKTAGEVLEIVKELHGELEEWHADNAYDEQLKHGATGEDFLRGFASAGMQFVYFNSLILIHRVPLVILFTHPQHLAGNDPAPYDTKLILRESSSSIAICVQAARDTLKLVNNLPWGDVAWVWSLLYYVFGAVMTIFINILRDSRHPHAKEDLQSLNMASTFFATLIPGDGPTSYAQFMTKMSANFERVARAVLERDQRSIKPNRASAYRATSRNSTLPSTSTSDDDDDEDARSHSQHREAALHASVSSSPVHSPAFIDIPHLPGLPRINSAGYVVPDSSPPTSDDLPPANLNSSLDDNIPQDVPPMSSQPYSNSNDNPAYSLEPFFPIPVSFPFPQTGLWQTPLIPDWGFGNPVQFNEDYYYVQDYFQPTAPATTVDVPPAPVNMGFAYAAPNNIPAGQTQGPSQTQPMWPGAGFGNPYP